MEPLDRPFAGTFPHLLWRFQILEMAGGGIVIVALHPRAFAGNGGNAE